MYSFLSSWTMSSSSTSASLSSPSSSSSSSSSPSLWTHFVFAVVIVLVYTTTASEACFIRNCPKGGKRSLGETILARRQCMPCGGLNQGGQCVGPAICCSYRFGCHFGTQETEVCQKENESVEPCYVTGDVCGANDGGNCVADGICCDSDSCSFNERCRSTGPTDVTGQDRGQILQLIKKLLRAKNFK